MVNLPLLSYDQSYSKSIPKSLARLSHLIWLDSVNALLHSAYLNRRRWADRLLSTSPIYRRKLAQIIQRIPRSGFRPNEARIRARARHIGGPYRTHHLDGCSIYAYGMHTRSVYVLYVAHLSASNIIFTPIAWETLNATRCLICIYIDQRRPTSLRVLSIWLTYTSILSIYMPVAKRRTTISQQKQRRYAPDLHKSNVKTRRSRRDSIVHKWWPISATRNGMVDEKPNIRRPSNLTLFWPPSALKMTRDTVYGCRVPHWL